MITIEKTLDIAPSYDFSLIAPKERILFFDIETTGLSAARSGLYLIGAVYWQDGAWQLRQWFADSLFDEEEMLNAFFGLLGEKKKLARAGGGRGSAVLIHFNGDTFDIPYIQRLARQYRLPWDLSGVLSIDLYKKIRPYRELLGLPNCKLKTVEQYFGISREDRYSGGELIYVYEEYLRLRNLEEGSCENNSQNRALRERLLQTLLLHNEEDMTNLPLLCGLLGYDELFRRQFSLAGAELVELPSTSVTAAVRAISLSVTLTTVTVAPMGRSSSMWAAQAARMSSSTGPLSAPAMTTLTVPFPAQSGMQLA